MRACLLEAFPRKAFLDIVRGISLVRDTVAPKSFFARRQWASSFPLEPWYQKLPCGIGVTATHMSNVQSAYFSVCGIVWPSKRLKQPSNKQPSSTSWPTKWFQLESIRSPVPVVADPAASNMYMVATYHEWKPSR